MFIFEIKNTKSEESDPATFAQILANFANQNPPSLLKTIFGERSAVLFLEIAVFDQCIHLFIVGEDYLKSYFYSQLTSQYPKAQVIDNPDYLRNFVNSPDVVSGELVLQKSTYLPLNTYLNFKNIDPLRSVLGIMSKFEKEEKGIIQIVLQPAGSNWQESIIKKVEKGIVDQTTGRRQPLTNERLIKEKIMINGLRCGLRLLVNAGSKIKAQTLINDLSGSFGVYSRGDGNSLIFRNPGFLKKDKFTKAVLDRKTNYLPKTQVLNIQEIAGLFHPPGDILAGVKNLAWGGQLLSEPPDNLPISQEGVSSNKINFFGQTEFKNQIRKFGILYPDRGRHMYVIGKTGTGKTTLIANMAINDARNGHGFAVIDPHGDLCNLLLDYIPRNRINDIAYLDPSDTEYPFHLNPLELMKESESSSQAELVASGIVSIFYKLYHYSWGPRLEYILRNALLTLTEIPDSTLVDIPRLLADQNFRTKIVRRLEDKVLIGFWENEFDKMSEKLRSEAISPILNKVGQFVGSPMIRNIIGAPRSTIDFARMMDEGKIIIANLSQGKLGEDNAALMGAMFITKMQLAAMSRVYKPEEERRDFYLYVDEFQNFATQSFIKILSEARKYKLNLILANQYIGQVDEEVRKAIFGNVGSIVSFLVGAEDAHKLSFEFGENYEEKDFVGLGRFQTLLKMAIDGMTSIPFYAQTLPLPYSKNNNREKIIKVSRERYSRNKNS